VEFLLLGFRGSCPFFDRSVKNWIVTGRGRHSEKPEEVRRLIERVSPAPRIELFARRPAEGWRVGAMKCLTIDSFWPRPGEQLLTVEPTRKRPKQQPYLRVRR
jgi:N6-adenosine-specific RNA methylase IME4